MYSSPAHEQSITVSIVHESRRRYAGEISLRRKSVTKGSHTMAKKKAAKKAAKKAKKGR